MKSQHFVTIILITCSFLGSKVKGQYLKTPILLPRTQPSRLLEDAGIQRRDYGFPPSSIRDFFTPRSFGQDTGPSLERDIGQDFGQDIGPNLRTDIGPNLRTEIAPYNGQHTSGLDKNYREGVLSGPDSGYGQGQSYGPQSYGQDRSFGQEEFTRRDGYPYRPPSSETYYNRQPVDSRNAYYGGHFGQPTGAADHSGPPDFDSDRSLTPEEIESKKQNPVPFFINPLIRRGTQGLQRIEANFVRDPKRNQLAKPILALLTNPSKK